MDDTGEPRYSLCLLSHGRQAAYALWCHLNAHPRLYLPDFAYSDGLLLEDAPYAPSGPYASQLSLPRAVPDLKHGVIVHLFSHLHRLPGPLPGNLARRLAPDPVFVLVPRDPIANLRSMHRTQLELWFGRRYFGLELPGHPLFDRSEPLGFADYVPLARYGVDYAAQLASCVPPAARTLLFDFDELGPESLGDVLARTTRAIGLDPALLREVGREATNAGSELIHQRLFSFRSRIELEDRRVDLGFFWRGTDPLLRGSFEIELAGPQLEGDAEVAAYGSSATWFALPPKTRRWIVEGAGWSLVAERWHAYRAYRARVEQEVEARVVCNVWSEGGAVLEELVLPAARAFRQRFPAATRSWSI